MVERNLTALLRATQVDAQHGTLPQAPLTALRQDSRDIQPGDCFVAVPGFTVDGHSFLEQAVGAGAVALVVQADHAPSWNAHQAGEVPLIVVPDTRIALADLAAAFHDFPARKLTVIGVTGTDGKTTTTYLVQSILEAAGRPCGLIGGVQFKIGDDWRTNTLTQTSLEADRIQGLLAEMVEAGQTHVVMEATSHGLALHRHDHCEFDIAVFTGLSDDHLDFHGDRESYLDAKLNLFRALDSASDKGVAKTGVAPHKDPHLDAIHGATSAPILSFGLENQGNDISASDLVAGPRGTAFRVVFAGGALGTNLRLPAQFNVRNALAATGAAVALGVPIGPIADGIAALPGVPGRMEQIDAGQPFQVIVDAAATEAALRTVLQELRPLVQGRLIVVFGCAGERDIARGEGMGRVAAELADYAVLTNENPRSADPQEIVAAIANAMRDAGAKAGVDFEEVADRREAIARGFDLATANDLVLVAGKGAEQTMIFADHTDSWDDRDVVRDLLRYNGYSA